MRLWMIVAPLLTVYGWVLGAEPAPVVLVWGEYLAATNAREAPGTRSYMANIASALDSVGLAYDETKDSEVENGALDGHKFAFFPYNADLTDAERDAIRKFVADGGRIWASFTGEEVFHELLGVDTRGSLASTYPGYYSSLMLNENAPPGAPDVVAAGSWQAHDIALLEGTKVIATWGDAEGKDTGTAAVTLNQHGYYHGHVILGADTQLKGQMFLALIGHFFPELWPGAVQGAIGKVRSVHGYQSVSDIADAIQRAKGRGQDVSVAERRLAEAKKAEQAANELRAQGKYPEALEQVRIAGEGFRSATVCDLRLSVAGEGATPSQAQSRAPQYGRAARAAASAAAGQAGRLSYPKGSKLGPNARITDILDSLPGNLPAGQRA